MNIINKDLNLLRIFHMLWLERNVSKAALKLGLSQPAISNALARMRLDFKDDLFVRASKGIIPTPMAERIHHQVEKILQETSALYEKQLVFDPKTSERVITIYTHDYFEQLFLPELLQTLEKEAPKMRLRSRSLQGKLPKGEMEEGICDLAIAGYFKNLPESFYQQEIFKDHYKCVVRKNHPALKQSLTLKRYAEMKHVLISPGGDLEGVVDEALADKGLKRSVVAGTASFMAPGPVIQKTDFILTAPSRLCEHFHEIYKLEILPTPVPVPSINIFQVWHHKVHQDPPIKWLRSKIFEMCHK